MELKYAVMILIHVSEYLNEQLSVESKTEFRHSECEIRVPHGLSILPIEHSIDARDLFIFSVAVVYQLLNGFG